jgi:gas vesicle protein
MRTSKAILGIAAGVAAGTILGVLMAPDSGTNTRKRIANRSQDAVSDLKSRFNHLVDSFTNHKEDMLASANKTLTDTARKIKVQP